MQMTPKSSAERTDAAGAESPSQAARDAARALFELAQYQKRHLEKQAASTGISLPLASLLWQLQEDKLTSMGAIAEFMHCDASNVTSMIDKLEGRGLLRRQPSAEDRRVKLIALTDEGRQFRQNLIARICEPTTWIVMLDEHDQLELARILRKARERLEAAGE